jgi:transcriptional regulator with XRE-family HTH domain
MQPTTDSQELGAQLRSIREAKGLSLYDVERRSAGVVKPSVLSSYERGDRTLSVLRASQIASALDVTLEVLLFGRPVTTTTFEWREAMAS